MRFNVLSKPPSDPAQASPCWVDKKHSGRCLLRPVRADQSEQTWLFGRTDRHLNRVFSQRVNQGAAAIGSIALHQTGTQQHFLSFSSKCCDSVICTISVNTPPAVSSSTGCRWRRGDCPAAAQKRYVLSFCRSPHLLQGCNHLHYIITHMIIYNTSKSSACTESITQA